MKSPTIRIPRPADPLRPEIERRLALKLAASERKAVPAPIVGPDALYDAAAFIRANPVAVVFLEVRS